MDGKFMLQTFLPDIIKDENELFLSEQNLAYYTNGDVLYSILKNKELWLRSTVCMNDYKEIKYAFEYIENLLLQNDSIMLRNIANILQLSTGISKEYLRNELVDMLDKISGGFICIHILCV